MASTTTGTDHQRNYLSITPQGANIGAGGPAVQQLTSLPNPLVADPARPFVPLDAQNTADPSTYDAVLKLADGLANQSWASVSVAQGHEDSLNLQNHACGLHVAGDFAVSGPPGLRVITIKGGSSNNVISGTIHQHGSGCDVKLGDWSDQSYNSSAGNDLSGLVMADGSPVVVLIGRATGTKLPTKCKVLFWGSLALKAYWWFKWAVRKVARIPVGTPGPSWLS